MLDIEITERDGSVRTCQVPDDCLIGKGEDCDLRLDSWRIGKAHARLFRGDDGVWLQDLGAYLGVAVNTQRIGADFGPLHGNDVVTVGPFRLRVSVAPEMPDYVKAAAPGSRSDTAKYRNHRATEEIQASRLSAERIQKEVLEGRRPASHGRQEGEESVAAYPIIVSPDAWRMELEFEWRKRIHALLLETMDLRRNDVSRMSDEQLRAQASELIGQILVQRDGEIPAELDRALLAQQVLDEAVGLGPLEALLKDASVTEIMVNRHDEIYVERRGRLEPHPMVFTSDRAVLGVIERIVAPLGRRIDESSPMVDARLQDGSRVNAVIAPLALKGATLTIRKFARDKMSVEDLVARGSLSEEMASFLRICVQSRRNIIVSGGTGSGKTTLLNILSNFIPVGERIITVEDAAELRLHHKHLISLEARPANLEGKGAVPIRDLVRNTLRMRPDRIVVGECRGAEALDMLQAMNTGHDGSLTTLHANSPRDSLARLETMVLMAGMDLPLPAVREQIVSAVQIIVQQTRFACGSRVITSIAEVTGMEAGKYQLQEIFRFVNRGYAPAAEGGLVQGYFTGCDLIPHFYEALQAMGAGPDIGIFRQRGQEAA